MPFCPQPRNLPISRWIRHSCKRGAAWASTCHRPLKLGRAVLCGDGFMLDAQADVLAGLKRRLVVPLLPAKRLNPGFPLGRACMPWSPSFFRPCKWFWSAFRARQKNGIRFCRRAGDRSKASVCATRLSAFGRRLRRPGAGRPGRTAFSPSHANGNRVRSARSSVHLCPFRHGACLSLPAPAHTHSGNRRAKGHERDAHSQ
jgi:hypothetical protein